MKNPRISAATLPSSAIRRVSILGSTGSIGTSTLDVIAQNPDTYAVEVLTAQDNVERLIEQSLAFRPALAVIGNEAHYERLKSALSGTGVSVAAGAEAICDAAARPSDWVMAAIVGAAGLVPTLRAIERGATIAFASKECLVSAGDVMMQACKQHNAVLLPVDSEHNAIFQVMDFSQPEQIEKVTLTASGGPFRTREAHELESVTPDEAVAHPKWDMGAKISVDSATMMNKGLEMIEAHHLFSLPSDQIDVVVHPESVIHSLVHYRDGSVLAQLGMPDMRIPIAYTLSWPRRQPVQTPRLDLASIGALHFEAPDTHTFPSLRLAREALEAGGCATTILNAANEVAVARFLKGGIRFTDIARIVESTLEKMPKYAISTMDDVLACDRHARDFAQNL